MNAYDIALTIEGIQQLEYPDGLILFNFVSLNNNSNKYTNKDFE